MSKRKQIRAESDRFFFMKKWSFFGALRLLILIGIVAVMCWGLWCIWIFKDLMSLVQTIPLKVFLLTSYGISAQMFSVVVWDMIFPNVFTRSEQMVFYLSFLGVFVVLGAVIFIVFLFVSVSFWWEDLISIRFFAPLIGSLLFGSFFLKVFDFVQ